MDDNEKITHRFLLERMDKMEQRIMSKVDQLIIDEIKPLRDFKNKVLGISFAVSGLVSYLIKVL